VTAATEAALCGEKHPDRRSVLCTREPGHQGGHLNQAHGLYWQAES